MEVTVEQRIAQLEKESEAVRDALECAITWMCLRANSPLSETECRLIIDTMHAHSPDIRNMDKCLYCSADAEFKLLVKNGDGTARTHFQDVCSEHREDKDIVDSWTKQEWLRDGDWR